MNLSINKGIVAGSVVRANLKEKYGFLTLAVSSDYGTNFISLKLFGKNLERTFTTGEPLTCVFSVSSSAFEDKSGNKHYNQDLIATNIIEGSSLSIINDAVKPIF